MQLLFLFHTFEKILIVNLLKLGLSPPKQTRPHNFVPLTVECQLRPMTLPWSNPSEERYSTKADRRCCCIIDHVNDCRGEQV